MASPWKIASVASVTRIGCRRPKATSSPFNSPQAAPTSRTSSEQPIMLAGVSPR